MTDHGWAYDPDHEECVYTDPDGDVLSIVSSDADLDADYIGLTINGGGRVHLLVTPDGADPTGPDHLAEFIDALQAAKTDALRKRAAREREEANDDRRRQGEQR